jgi:two-component system LytT family response regulator
VHLVTEGRTFLTDFTLKDLETRLDPQRFARIHRSAIVALDRVREVHRWFHGEAVVLLDDRAGTRLKVGRSYQDAFRSRLGGGLPE